MSEQQKMDSDLRQIVTEALVSMISGVTGLVPPSGPGAIPDFVQAPIDRAVERISASLLVGVPDINDLAQFIRQIDGDNRMGAGVMAEHICEWLAAAHAAQPAAEQSPTVKESLTVAEQSAPDHAEDALGMVEQSAPGEVDGPDITTKHGYPAYSVAQHKRIVAQLAAQLEQMTTQCQWSQERASAWDAVVEKLRSINPAMMQGMGRTGLECAIAQIEQLAARDAGEVRVPGWVPVAERLPNCGQAVLAYYLNRQGMGRRIRAEYVTRWTVEAEMFADPDTECVEYSEQEDTYYVTEGWYELIDNWDEYARIAVNEGVVTRWMPMPAAPAAHDKQSGGEAASALLAQRERENSNE